MIDNSQFHSLKEILKEQKENSQAKFSPILFDFYCSNFNQDLAFKYDIDIVSKLHKNIFVLYIHFIFKPYCTVQKKTLTCKNGFVLRLRHQKKRVTLIVFKNYVLNSMQFLHCLHCLNVCSKYVLSFKPKYVHALIGLLLFTLED